MDDVVWYVVGSKLVIEADLEHLDAADEREALEKLLKRNLEGLQEKEPAGHC